MDTTTVGIHSPGDMGHAIGRELRERGVPVIACLQGRSDRTRSLSEAAGIDEVETLVDLVANAGIILSVLVPSRAQDAARQLADAMRTCGRATHVVDCNAVAPQTVKQIGTTIQSAGGIFSDASLIGLPPGPNSKPRLYVSGPETHQLVSLNNKGIEVITLGDEIGQASGIKMCYAAMTKGTFALQFALTIVAERLGLLEPLLAEFDHSQAATMQRMQRVLPKLPAKAWRWVGEMEEIAATFRHEGITPDFHLGARDLYELVSHTSLGQETPETIDLTRTLEQTISTISAEHAREK